MCAGPDTKPPTVKDLPFRSDRFRLYCRVGMAACILLAALSPVSSISRAVAAETYDDFLQRRNQVVIRLADKEDHFSCDRFDPMAVEILDQGEALQAHLLTSFRPRGEVSFEHPLFLPRSLEGVIALTSPAGQHPFLHGYRRIAFSGFPEEPVVERTGL